ncbi:BAG domain-containing protein Samui [Anopheles nili]|uniref:BAG domain-containing protein Samui n=1 Tax=Anopheles nili TaxID=185578 RepID=UPI00237AE92F|nr:BAG domain-containing protein Samui [Anopheles nili]
MSSQQEQPQQPTVRHIPIFVEGRSEPLVNKAPESQPSQSSHPSQPPSGMENPNMEFPKANENDLFDRHFKRGDNFKSIFDQARDIPVRSFVSSTFMPMSSGFKREPSPGASRTSPFSDAASYKRSDTDPQSAHMPRGSSMPRQTPSPPNASQTQPKQPQQAAPQQQQQQPQQEHVEAQAVGQDHPDCRPKMPLKDDPIMKIQKIQKDVLAIFDQVELFKGGKDGKKDKTYMYLDEMLTQNLLKLDSIDAEDQPQIKSARKEAIKSINTCIAVLEAKAEAGASGSTNASSSSIGKTSSTNGMEPNGIVGDGKSASNTSISRTSSNSSHQQQPNLESNQ